MKPYNEREFNKLCAEFMGLKPLQHPYTGAFIFPQDSSNIPVNFVLLVHNYMEEECWYVYPKFHSDWNWIMEVTERIESLGYWVETVSSHLGTKSRNYPILWCEIGKENHCDLLLSDCYTKIARGESVNRDKKEAVVQAIWQFINWYNEQKS